MLKKTIILILLSLTMFGCTQTENNTELVHTYYQEMIKSNELTAKCYSDLARCEVHSIPEENLEKETKQWCYLVVTDGERPIVEGREIIDIRTLNLTTDQVNSYEYDTWNYWLACSTKYR